MIGVIVHEQDKEIATELFELFKTPWEFYEPGRQYKVIITNAEDSTVTSSPLVIMYGLKNREVKKSGKINAEAKTGTNIVRYKNTELPIYGILSGIDGAGIPFLWNAERKICVGTIDDTNGNRRARIGYDIFDETRIMLTSGQPQRYAHIPTLECHIDLIRDLIVESGISMVEMPPVPAGYQYAVCLTHDIDFFRLSDHIYNSTLFGFIYRASIGSVIRYIQGKISLADMMHNFGAVLSVPFVFLGLCRDFWKQIPEYMQMEKDWKSTFFLLPKRDRAGIPCGRANHERRASKYDVEEMEDEANEMVKKGFEIGVHGIDAWNNVDAAKAERQELSC